MSFEVMDPDPIRRVEVALDDIKAGKMVILVDDEDRENEGDLVMASSHCRDQDINFMATWGRGLICLTLTQERVQRLGLTMMASNNQSPYQTAFTVSIEAREGVSTGISAADRARTVEVAIDPKSGPQDIVTPGHIFPLQARDGGVLVRTGQTEGSVDLARMAGLTPSGVICEIMKDDGTMARMPDLIKFGTQHQLHIVTIADMIAFRMQRERLVSRVVDALLPIPGLGEFNFRLYRSQAKRGLHMALWKGTPTDTWLVRMQAADPVADVFCHGFDKLEAALVRIASEGGLLVYLNMSGGRTEEDVVESIQRHLKPLPGQQPAPQRRPNAEEGLRDFGTGAQILVDMGVRRIRQLTNNPRRIVGLEAYGLEIVEHVPLDFPGESSAQAAERRQALGKLIEIGK